MAQIIKIKKGSVVVGSRADLDALFRFSEAQTIDVRGRLVIFPVGANEIALEGIVREAMLPVVDENPGRGRI